MLKSCCYCFSSSAEASIVQSCSAQLELLIPNPNISSCLTYLFLLCIFIVLKCDLESVAIRIWLRGVGLAANGARGAADATPAPVAARERASTDPSIRGDDRRCFLVVSPIWRELPPRLASHFFFTSFSNSFIEISQQHI